MFADPGSLIKPSAYTLGACRTLKQKDALLLNAHGQGNGTAGQRPPWQISYYLTVRPALDFIRLDVDAEQEIVFASFRQKRLRFTSGYGGSDAWPGPKER